MNLLDCNEDALCLILGYLAQADLDSVCLAHPHLRRLAEPVLYSTVEIEVLDCPQAAPPPIPSLVGTILRRPELAAHVRTLSLKGGHPSRWGGGDRRVPKLVAREPDLLEAISFVERTGLSYRGTWSEELRRGTRDAYLAVLISQLPRLQRLHLGCGFFIENGLIALVLRSILCDSHSDSSINGIPTTLNQLHTVTLKGYRSRDDRSIRNTANALPFFYLPSLRKMSLFIDDPLVPTLPWPTAEPPSPSSLTSLKVLSMRESHLGQLLAALPQLRSLSWQWVFDPDFEDQFNSPIINLDQLMPALAHVRETLTELTIVASCSYANRAATPFPLQVQGSARALAGFDHLTKLVVPLAFFTGFAVPIRGERLADCLPRNLEELTLADDLYIDTDGNEEWDEPAYTRSIVAWLAGGRASTPRLRKLCLVLMCEDGEVDFEWLDVRNEIRELGRRMGIDVTTQAVHDFGENLVTG